MEIAGILYFPTIKEGTSEYYTMVGADMAFYSEVVESTTMSWAKRLTYDSTSGYRSHVGFNASRWWTGSTSEVGNNESHN